MAELPVTYDKWGRMQYHPDFHFRHGQLYTPRELAFLVQNYRPGHVKDLQMVVGRTEHCIRSKIAYLRKTKQFDRYMKMDIGEWYPEEKQL